ncbi:MAG: hypothetical protein DHS20C02_09370 [Micavibrio sp.]|nr:MAG: hypothetical protein DHS20C02_09370 [Micavibrio sp.]
MKHPLVPVLGVTLSLLLYSAPASANDPLEAHRLQVSRLGDTELSCGALSQEAALMRDIIDTTQDIQDSSEMKSHGINAAAGVGGFLIGTVTGGIGFAAAGFLLDQSTKDDASEADSVQDTAQQRRSLMMGIYNAKGCLGPIEHAMQDRVTQEKQETRLAAIETQAGKEKEPRKPRYNE